MAGYAICRSNPILVNSSKTFERFDCGFKEIHIESFEDYTYVTIYGRNHSFTKGQFRSVVNIVFQSVFRLKIHQNNIFIF